MAEPKPTAFDDRLCRLYSATAILREFADSDVQNGTARGLDLLVEVLRDEIGAIDHALDLLQLKQRPCPSCDDHTASVAVSEAANV